jgi:hypothetical protein
MYFSIFRLPMSNEDVINQDHDYDFKEFKKPQSDAKSMKTSAPADNNKKVTEFFTVRRSVRKTKKEVQAERMRTLEQAIKENREDGLEVNFDCNCDRFFLY